MRGLANRLRVYKITSKEYYDKYIKKEDEGKCLHCKIGTTTFINLTKGYHKFCCCDCSGKDESHRKAVSQRFINNPATLVSFHNKMKENYNPIDFKFAISKTIETKTERYGEKYFSEMVKEVWSKRSPEERQEIAKKAIQTRSGKTWYKSYTLGEEIKQVQGYEPFVLDFLLEYGFEPSDIKIGVEQIPTIEYQFLDTKRKYYPDIYIPKLNLIIEVKSTYTLGKNKEMSEAKQIATQKNGYNFVFIVFKRAYSEKVRKDTLDKFKKYLDWLISSQATRSVEGSTTMAEASRVQVDSKNRESNKMDCDIVCS